MAEIDEGCEALTGAAKRQAGYLLKKAREIYEKKENVV
jgi:hypothetical protein